MRARGTLEFAIRGMDCSEEVAILKREVGPVVGGPGRLRFDVLRGKMTVEDPPVSSGDIMRAVARTGMTAEPWIDATRPREQRAKKTLLPRGRLIATCTSGLMTLAGFLAHVGLSGGVMPALGAEGVASSVEVPLAARLAYAVGVMAGAWYVVPKAWGSLRRLKPDMNLLMTIAVVGALLIGEWLEAALVSFLFALSLALEAWSIGRARGAVEALLDLAPPTVRVLRDGRDVEIPAAQVAVGTPFLVKPGDRIALDGRVTRGISQVDQAPITGESLPVLKEPGDDVFAGTINGDGALEVESTKSSSDTTLAHIIEMVGAAQAKKAPSEQWVERFARFYTPSVFALAALVFLFPPLFLEGAWEEWTYRALVLLVIGCPCALVISTPVSIVAAVTAAARKGVLIKGGTYVEVPGRLRAIAIDKTGTLTEGRPRVHAIYAEAGRTPEEILKVAMTMESLSDHPIARAIAGYCHQHGIRPGPVEDFSAIPGKGTKATIEGRSYWIGSHRLMQERSAETADFQRRMKEFAASGHSVVALGQGTQVIGLITLADAARSISRETVAKLRQAGVDHVAMLTGDNQATAMAVAQATGVDEVYAELLPEDKVSQIEDLVQKYGTVAMVGDGVNDAPSMARASLGIAMAAVGSDAAIEAADVALMSDDLSKLPWLIAHSRRTLAIIRQNITLSLVVKAVFATLAFTGFASLWAAITADMGVSLLVIFNALRLLKIGEPDSAASA